MSGESTTTTTVVQNLLQKTSTQDLNASLTSNSLFLFVLASFALFILLLLIFALYKYRNRDEGSYRIDESKNCGPFAELSMPLNGAGHLKTMSSSSSGASYSSSSKKKSNAGGKKGAAHNNPNKEWYV